MAGFMYFILTAFLSVSLGRQIVYIVRDVRAINHRKQVLKHLKAVLCGGAENEAEE